MISGCATASATKEYADKQWKKNPHISPNSWKIIEGCTVGKIGFGSYRIGNEPAHEASLRKSLLSGVNLIDTASNYTDGQAESMIGKILSALISNKELRREEVMIISKGGYIQGGALLHAQTLEDEHTLKLNDNLWYSIHPNNLKTQLQRSRERLGVETIDGYLIHNPEYILSYVMMEKSEVTDADRDAFYAQLEESFVFLEQQVKEGTISFYGVSSNTFGSPDDHPDYIDLSRLNQTAANAAAKAWGRKKRSMFRCIEMPMNIMELGALHQENNTAQTFDGEERVSVLELASRMHLNVLTNRPLNAFPLSGGTFRLAEGAKDYTPSQLDTAVEKIKQSEDALNKVLEGWPQMDNRPLFNFTSQGEELLAHMTGSIQYDHLCSSFLYGHIAAFNHAMGQLRKNQPEKAESLQLVQQNYNQNMQALLETLRQHVRQKDEEAVRPLEMELRNRVPEKWKSTPLQSIALNAIASLPGVSCVLCGMRQENYVDNAIETFTMGDFADPAAIIGSQLNS